MKFSEREEILRQREIRKEMLTRYRSRFIASTFVIILALLSSQLIHKKTPDIPQPTQHDIKIAKELTTIEGREAAIDKKYDTAKIIAERTYGKDIISVFEVDYLYSFCVFEALENGYWMEYCGNLFPKTQIVKGTVPLGDNTDEYDIYLKGDTPYTRLVSTWGHIKNIPNIKKNKMFILMKTVSALQKMIFGALAISIPKSKPMMPRATNTFWMAAAYSKHFLVLSSILFYNKRYEKF
ncbi:hypothetical protein [Anaerotignum sp.]